tara:strand:- start:4553 stop:5683 length:1131 start_codon:yes stop_codon:yes gene_type:complete
MQPTCCYRAALDLEAGFCDGCGKPLLRCAAFEECGGLLDERGACGVCVAPELTLDAGGVRDVKVGGALTLPLLLRNTASIGRPLFVKGMWTREAGGDWETADLPWDRLDAGETAPLSVRAQALDRAGEHQLEIGLALATRWRWREEVLAYTAGLAITVEGDEQLTVQQNITYAGDGQQTGTIYAPFRFQSEGGRRSTILDTKPKVLPLTRASRLERAFGLRGDTSLPTVPRNVRILWDGFVPGSTPSDGPIVTADGLLSLGRARARMAGGANDVRLLAQVHEGPIDQENSRSISRQHFSLCVENDRLVLRVESERGAWVNDHHVARGTSVALKDGDRFSPLPRGQGLLSVNVRFEENHGVVDTVTLQRRPGTRPGA